MIFRLIEIDAVVELENIKISFVTEPIALPDYYRFYLLFINLFLTSSTKCGTLCHYEIDSKPELLLK